ncbi:outer membrane protein [Pseudooceanicola sp. HF7]|uniref:outer membrane protein n=1 Tax=Pseudooceanicola sp. HF7 TaxID=2721560 RepID=UPI0014314592|nr:outer membrane beta-barrel protein [Pseudooceanicola sp. HF7]NIZ08257.1 porin family protein [Pseudooceanicola sp. HF7]
MLRTKIIAATAATCALAAPAFAGSMNPAPADPVVPAPVVPVYSTGADWTGGYVGLNMGYGDLSAGSASSDGLVYGIQGGYDHDFGNFVLGGELEYQGNDISSSNGLSLDNTMRAKLRAGYDAGPALIYGVVGAVNADSNVGSDTGYTVGLGAEYMVTDTVSVGAEYLYDDISDFNDSGTDYTGNTVTARVNYRF